MASWCQKITENMMYNAYGVSPGLKLREEKLKGLGLSRQGVTDTWALTHFKGFKKVDVNQYVEF
jgi:hypothetical protein